MPGLGVHNIVKLQANDRWNPLQEQINFFAFLEPVFSEYLLTAVFTGYTIFLGRNIFQNTEEGCLCISVHWEIISET